MFSPTEYKRILTFKTWAINDAYYDQTLINTNMIDVQNDHGKCVSLYLLICAFEQLLMRIPLHTVAYFSLLSLFFFNENHQSIVSRLLQVLIVLMSPMWI